MKKVLLMLVILLSTISTQARKFYVSESGSDTYTTTQAQSQLTPWQTLSKVQSNVANGDSVLFAKGSKFAGTLTLNSKSNIYFGVYGTGADPLFWGNGATISVLIRLNSCTNLTFYGWNISDTTISFTDRTVQAKIQNVFALYSSSTGIVIRKCNMDRIGYGAYFPPFCDKNTMDSCSIGNLRMIRNTPTSVNPDDDYGGVPIQLSSKNNTVTNNYFHDCYAVSYDYGYDGGGVEFFEEGSVIENNIIAYNTFYDCNGTFEFGSNNDGIANNIIQNNKIYYNKIINSSSLTYINNNGQYRTNVRNLQFYNNVIIQNVPSRTGGTRMLSRALTDTGTGIIVMKNNIFQISNGASVARSGQWAGADLVHTNNIYKLSNGSVTNFTLDPTEISTSGIIWTNTSNTNPLNWDYTLTSTSPAINSGVNVGLTRDFIGNSVGNIPSIGIYQYGGSVAPTPCTFAYGTWTTCTNGTQTRTYTSTPAGCTGVPPSDSITRTCTSPIVPCTFTYGTWTTCTNGTQTRTYTSTPAGCTGVPPTDSITKTCISPIVNGRKFYFSSSGNDSYTVTQAQNPATPWLSLRKLTSLTTGTNGPTVFRAGDSICFKRGDVFYGNPNDNYCAAYFWNNGGSYFTAPSGTPDNPIVITNYGDPSLPLPNWLHPRAYYPVSSWPYTREGRGIIEFAGVHDIVIDGIQSNDFRVPEVDKQNPGYSGGWIIGEWTKGTSTLGNSFTDPNRRKSMVTRFVIKNCKFNNTMYGIQSLAAIDSKITNCSFTNFKSSSDTAGVNDIMAGAIEGLYGIRVEISHNYIKGAWAKSGRIASCNGLGGVAFDIFGLYNSKICYNTVIDCNGMMEFGNLDNYDSTGGSSYDTIAFNKVINCEQLAYFHGSAGDVFAGNNHHMSFWNNVVISNNKDRHIGWGFGKDTYGDGQGFIPGTPNPWWFCRNPYSTFNQSPAQPTTTTTAGSNIITVSNTTGIYLGSVAFINNDSLLGKNYQTVTVTNISGNQLTLSVPCTQTRTTTNIEYHLPLSNQTWSAPSNSSFANYGGKRVTIQYSGDNTRYGSYIDTMFDMRNNIFYWTTGVQGVYDRTRFKRSNNIYCPLGTVRYSSSLGGTLKSGERVITTKIFRDTTASFPEDWDLHLVDTSYGIGRGLPTPGFNKDFDGNLIGSTPSIGLYQQTGSPTTPCTFTYGQWTTCSNGIQTRTYTTSPAGCSGTPPLDSTQRTCTTPIVPCTFIYNAWSTCSNGIQTRTYSDTPINCIGAPPLDSTQRTCTVPPTTNFYYDGSRVSIYIKYNRDGRIRITNLLGQSVANIRYSNVRNGKYIDVSFLAPGSYIANTYGMSIIFTR
jgi:hypothetical protein